MNDSRGFDATNSERPNTLCGRLLGLLLLLLADHKLVMSRLRNGLQLVSHVLGQAIDF